MVNIAKFLIISTTQFDNLASILNITISRSNELYMLTYLFTNFFAYIIILFFLAALIWCYKFLFSRRKRSWL